MMDEKRSSLFGLGNHQNPNFSQLSPYLNVDPSYLGNQTPEFVVNPDLERTKLEGSFSVIGGALFVGGAAGGAYGLFEGIRNTALAENMSSKVRRTQILNHTLKSGASASNALGTVTFLYSTLYWLMSWAHEEGEDYTDLKSLLSGGLTGALYKSAHGAKKSALGGAFGLSLAALWTLGVRRTETVSHYV